MTHPAFLGVEASASGRRWVGRSYDERLAETLAQRHALPDLIAQSLAARGVTLETAESFLQPRLRDLLPDPAIFKDMERAATRFAEAIQRNEKTTVYGDYDVDGATSSALLIRFARAVGIDLNLYVPDRLREGYGPNVVAMQQLAADGSSLIICVDCGTTAHQPLAAASAAGADVIILDHHASEPTLPPCYALVNPNRLDESGEYGTLAAVGVTYMFIIAVNRVLRNNGWFSDARPEPDLLQLLDLVALGTVCDVVRLSGLNRAFVVQGLRVMSNRRNAGIVALAAVAGYQGVMDSYTAGFILGPRVNAGGRVGESNLGAKLLSTDDPSTAAKLAEHLHILNEQRRAIEANVLAEAESITPDATMPMAFVARENWHPGVIGIVASRLKDKFHHPAMVVALEGDVGKGSGRSVTGVDLGAAIIAARQAGLLINGGGHKMAAGFTVARDKIPELKNFLADRIRKQIIDEPLVSTLTVDGLLAAASLQPEFVRTLLKLSPFGIGNPEPRFAFADCRIVRATVVGEKHVSVIATQSGAQIRGIAFRAVNSPLGEVLLDPKRRNMHLAGKIKLDEWQGVERVQVHIDDAAPL
jgi:single-stranded-DNA-specific exonuclease